MDEVADGADLQAVFLGEFNEVGQTRHRAVFVEDLADDGGRFEPGQLRQIAAGLGVPGADEYAAFSRHEGEDVPRLDDVFRLGMAGHRRAHGLRPVVRRDAGGHPARRFDRGGEGGFVGRAVVLHHEFEAELLAALFRERQADEAAAVFGHEVDRLGGDAFGREHEIALVFPRFVVDEDHHVALADLVDDGLDGADPFARGGKRCGGMGVVHEAGFLPAYSSTRAQ